jgi:hypothetical protein
MTFPTRRRWSRASVAVFVAFVAIQLVPYAAITSIPQRSANLSGTRQPRGC